MKKKLLSRSFVMFGLLFFTMYLSGIMPNGVLTASAANVEEEKSDYILNVKSHSLVKGKTYNLKVYKLNSKSNVSFKSSDSDIASVNDDGVVTANKVGLTTITVTIKEGFKSENLTCEITVGPPAISVRLTKSRIIIGKDEIDLLKVILKPSNTAEAAQFTSLNPLIAKVSSISGRLTAKELGLTYLFAEIGEKSLDTYKYAKCTVIVTQPENVEALELFFNNHPGVDMIPETDLELALEEFFNTNSVFNALSKLTQSEALYKYLKDQFKLDELDELCKLATSASDNSKPSKEKYSITQNSLNVK